ncbi:unnamed protein product [Prorocentrum cordatum]|uniref:Acyltransferase n=1 Tax=Prorocentrum cordatum TaxID=2364126 RepID=A0ABN9U1B9_9DINO|nr:unnamed protein product [Polarella glacialis]
MPGSPLQRAAAAAAGALAVAQLPPLAARPLWARALLCALAAYLPSYLDGAECRGAPLRSGAYSLWFRALARRLLRRAFDIRDAVLEDAAALSRCKQCILAVHPHGVLSLDHLLTVAGYDAGLEAALPQARRCALSASVLFRLPLLREHLLLTGCVDASRKSADRCLEKGLSLSVVPGGEREQLLATRGPVERLVLRRRQGFVKLALRHGVPIVPAYCFGEAQLYDQSRWCMGLRSWVQRTFGVALVMPYGHRGLPGVPHRTPVCTVVGAPLDMPRIEGTPTQAQVDEHHARYVAEVERIFAQHKAAAGYPDVQLQLL